MEHYEETPAGFAEKIGVNRSNITHLFSGRNQPSLDFAKKVLTAFPEVSTEWLIMGVGKMIKDPAEMMPAKKTFVQTDLFGAVDESETMAPIVEEVKEIVSEQAVQQPAKEILLESVKPVTLENSTAEQVQQIDTENIKSDKESVYPAPESNIQQQPVPQPEKSDSRAVEHEDAKQAATHSNPQPKAKPVTPSVEKARTKPEAIPMENPQARSMERPVATPVERPQAVAMEKNMATPTERLQAVPEAKPVAVQTEQASAPKEKKIEKIIFFYDDDTFKVYHP
jgi:DNA-binding XRE family transcriptional regulator